MLKAAPRLASRPRSKVAKQQGRSGFCRPIPAAASPPTAPLAERPKGARSQTRCLHLPGLLQPHPPPSERPRRWGPRSDVDIKGRGGTSPPGFPFQTHVCDLGLSSDGSTACQSEGAKARVTSGGKERPGRPTGQGTSRTDGRLSFSPSL